MSQRFLAWIFLGLEVLILTFLILTTRCANYQDVFVGGNIYYTDPDCYARMTRVRLCAQHPGLILRHHRFENFPDGTTPHTTAPLDYLILGLAICLRPFTSRPIDLAGAFISPLLGLVAGGFLWWWSRRIQLRFRWAMLILFCLSPILVHGTALGRPDHQSLIMFLVIAGVCALWLCELESSVLWGAFNGIAWGFAIWVSAYEPLVLFVLCTVAGFFLSRKNGVYQNEPGHDRAGLTSTCLKYFTAPHRRAGWIAFAIVLLVAFIVERRLPSFAVFAGDPIFKNWSRSIGELSSVSLLNPIWLTWVGWLILAVPFLIFFRRSEPDGQSEPHGHHESQKHFRANHFEGAMLILLGVTFCLTIWQARWGYFFALFFIIALPGLLERIKWVPVAWALFACSLFPILGDWDRKIWPDDATAIREVERRHEAVELRESSVNLIAMDVQPFVAPWWLSPAVAYWSGQPGVAGSSHESLPGIRDSARLFLSEDANAARQILRQRQVLWVLAYDADRVDQNSAALLGRAVPSRSLAQTLDRRPTQAPRFLVFSAQNGTEKLFRVGNKW